jgi:Protein of unknown function (DUF1800)
LIEAGLLALVELEVLQGAQTMSNSLSRSYAFRSGVAAILAIQMMLPVGLSAQMAEPAGQMSGSGDQAHGATRTTALTAKPGSPLTQDERILHALNRLTYGPRPGDFERVKAMGLQAWIVQQMSPQKIDDSPLEARLAEFPAMSLPLAQLMAAYPTQAMVRQEAQGKINPMTPGGEAERAIYADQMAREKDKKKGKPDSPNAAEGLAMDANKAQAILTLPPAKRFSALCKMSLPEIRSLRQGLRGEDRERLTDGFTP